MTLTEQNFGIKGTLSAKMTSRAASQTTNAQNLNLNYPTESSGGLIPPGGQSHDYLVCYKENRMETFRYETDILINLIITHFSCQTKDHLPPASQKGAMWSPRESLLFELGPRPKELRYVHSIRLPRLHQSERDLVEPSREALLCQKVSCFC